MLTDKFGRNINYLRIAVTDRCNLRCNYCMPENQHFMEREQLLGYEEIIRLVSLLSENGVNKVRVTGGEPFVRKDISSLLKSLGSIENIKQLSITTNGVLTFSHIADLVAAGIKNVNLSLDTLKRDKFLQLTHRDDFLKVLNSFHALLANDFNVKLNMVVMRDNVNEILDFVELTKALPLSVRFIEEMPFNGQGHAYSGIEWNYTRILSHIETKYNLQKEQDPANAIAVHYKPEGHMGSIAVIPAFSRTLCGSCNRLRITATGGVRTCLYGNEVLNVRNLMRNGASDTTLIEEIQNAVYNKPMDGFTAAASTKAKVPESMSLIGG
ncbi:GTP 3',8-cyclase MoaA [Chitinophagaceae bacterium 26-R-25]|nr:GTP 3',8-cyclase MoaA [Chitinophagaceae bacterium 26-R-25]